MLGSFAFINLAAHFMLGWIGDRVNKPGLLVLCHFAPAVAVMPLFGEASLWQLWLFTSCYTLLDASFPIVWATVGDFFGRKHFATIRGMLSFFYMWGSFAGPVVAGAIFDRSQSYQTVMWGLLTVLVVAMLLNALLIVPWRKKMSAGQNNR
jgi:MFS family permease